MSHETVDLAAKFIFDAQLHSDHFTVVWHAGEPLVVPPNWYRQAIGAIQQAAPATMDIPHAIQTNGILISDEWCDLFLETGMRVGVSIDGPARLHDERRKTRAGTGTHALVMRGIDFLRKRGVNFHVICVLGRNSLGVAEEILHFFRSEGICDVGFNIEEIEGHIVHSTLAGPETTDYVRNFFSTAIRLAENGTPLIRIRERDRLIALLRDPAFGSYRHNSQNAPFGIVTVTTDGHLFTFSPELAGLSHARYPDFSIGTVRDATLDSVLASPTFQAIWQEVQAGVNKCKTSCPYFDLCLGGAPVNKLYENGRFDSTETMFCRLSHQAVADVVLTEIETQMAGPS